MICVPLQKKLTVSPDIHLALFDTKETWNVPKLFPALSHHLVAINVKTLIDAEEAERSRLSHTIFADFMVPVTSELPLGGSSPCGEEKYNEVRVTPEGVLENCGLVEL
jgi:hypothetical protein